MVVHVPADSTEIFPRSTRGEDVQRNRRRYHDLYVLQFVRRMLILISSRIYTGFLKLENLADFKIEKLKKRRRVPRCTMDES